MVYRRAAFRTAFSVLFSLVAASVQAAPVSEGVHVYITPKGQNYFKTDLNAVILGNRLDLSNNVWDEIKFPVGKSLSSASDDFSELSAQMSPYFYGFPLNPPKLEGSLRDSNLKVKFKTLGAEIDPSGPSAYGYPHAKGVIILMRMEARDLQFTMKTLRLDDLANKGLLGILGVDDFEAHMTNGSTTTIKAELPILVEADGQKASLKILAIKTNLQKALFESNFDKLRVPTLKVVIDNKEYPFDVATFEKELRARLPQITTTIVTKLRAYFEKGYGKDLIQARFDTLASRLNIDLPYPKVDAKMTVTLRPQLAEFTRAKLLGISFDTDAVDGKRPSKSKMTLTTNAALESFDADTYDIGGILSPGTVNGVLERAWANGVLRKFSMGKDDAGHPTKISITQPPIVSFIPAVPGAGQVQVHAAIGYFVRGVGRILFKGPIPIEFDLVAKIDVNAKNEAEFSLDHIDESTLKVDTSATWLWPIRGLVNNLVRKKVKQLNEDAKNAKSIVSFPIPEVLLGVPLRIKSVSTEAGNLIVLSDIVAKP
jgi:hypothetical protein